MIRAVAAEIGIRNCIYIASSLTRDAKGDTVVDRTGSGHRAGLVASRHFADELHIIQIGYARRIDHEGAVGGVVLNNQILKSTHTLLEALNVIRVAVGHVEPADRSWCIVRV